MEKNKISVKALFKFFGIFISCSSVMTFTTPDEYAWMIYMPIIIALGIIVFELAYFIKE